MNQRWEPVQVSPYCEWMHCLALATHTVLQRVSHQDTGHWCAEHAERIASVLNQAEQE